MQVTSLPNPSSMKPSIGQNALPWLLLSVFVIVLDQITKAIVLAHIEPYHAVSVIAGFLNWTLAFNEGAAFSFLNDQGGWQHWLFGALALIVSLMLIAWLRRIARSDWRTALPLALVIGGALGNLIDRVRLGHVVDFIQVYYQQSYFPTFNVADSAISVGAILLAGLSLFATKVVAKA